MQLLSGNVRRVVLVVLVVGDPLLGLFVFYRHHVSGHQSVAYSLVAAVIATLICIAASIYALYTLRAKRAQSSTDGT